MKMYKFFGLFIIVNCGQSMELDPLNINNLNNFTNYNYNITPNNFYNGYHNTIGETNQEGWSFFSLNGSIQQKKDFIDNKYDQLINGKSSLDLQQLVNNPEIPKEVAAAGSTYWNGNYCFYSNGDVNSMWISMIYKSYIKRFDSLMQNMFSFYNGRTLDPNSDKLYTYHSLKCNKKTCTKSNLNGISIGSNDFICPNAEFTQLASNEKNTLWQDGCFHKPKTFTPDSSFNCYYPNSLFLPIFVQLNNSSDKKLVNDNIDDNFFCYPFFSQYVQAEDCLKEKLDLFPINSIHFFIPKQFSKPTFIWDGDHNRCFYYDGVERNDNKIFYYGNLPYMYSYHSIHPSCNSNNCLNNKIIPMVNGFFCSLTPPLTNGNGNKITVTQSVNPSDPTEVAPAGSTHWNTNLCLYSTGSINSSLVSIILKSHYKAFFVKPYLSGALDPNSHKVYTYYSNLCNKKTCTTDNLKNLTITNNNFVCPQAEDTQLASNEKNTLWKDLCFHKPKTFTPDSSFNCYYPNSMFYRSFIQLNNSSDKKLVNNNIDDNFFCYPFFSESILPEDCVKEKLDLLTIDSDRFFIPRQFTQLNFIWDKYYNRCFYYDGVEINDNKIFFYGNLPYMYSYHSNDLSCNINNCKNGLTANPNTNQFKCIRTSQRNYGITTYYPMDFTMIERFFNAIGSLFKIPSMDTLHWAIYYPLMVILYPLSPWITVFWEPWINIANSIQLFMLYKNQ